MKRFPVQFVMSVVAIGLFAVSIAHAQDPVADVQARAGALATWREQCNDPNPDLRLAYIEAAIASGDVSIQRICIRQALESDNADIRNLGLRAALASTSQITFSTEMPKGLAAAYKAAGDDEGKIRNVEDRTDDRIYKHIRTGMAFVIQKASIEKGQSEWFPLVANANSDSRFTGKAIVTGSSIHWVGSILIGGGQSRKCVLDVSAKSGAKLSGTLNCENSDPFSISAELL
ncbi:hypothetical protein [Megalodesulfovibrio paquesii]